jgi:acetylglutamate synthase
VIKSLIDESHYRTIDIYIYIYTYSSGLYGLLVTGPTTHAAIMLLEDTYFGSADVSILGDESGSAILSS